MVLAIGSNKITSAKIEHVIIKALWCLPNWFDDRQKDVETEIHRYLMEVDYF